MIMHTPPARVKVKARAMARLALALLLLLPAACGSPPWNDPHPAAPDDRVTYYSTMFPSAPKHLDPARAYASDEMQFIMQIYEPPLGYHFLERPYALVPLGVESLPAVDYLDAQGQRLAPASDVGAPPADTAFTRYTLRVRADARYQPHPAFARDPDGAPVYLFADAAAGAHLRGMEDFLHRGSRAVLAEDYVYGIKRLADPHNSSPLLGFMGRHIVGMQALTEQLGQMPRERWIDLRSLPLAGATVEDERTFSITINGVYPQFPYWLTMNFFAPVPWEADRFYHNPGFASRNLTLDSWPVGSGPFLLRANDPNRALVLERNPNFRHDTFPGEGSAADAAAGRLDDAGRRLPLIDRAVFRRERAILPLWTKFLQGYYDRSGEEHGNTAAVFDQAFVQAAGGIELNPELARRGVRLSPDIKPAVQYFGFNLQDPVLGGYSEAQRKLRRALQIAFDTEEYLGIFYQGNGIVAHSPIPPGISGHLEGAAGINPHTHVWENGAPRRRSLAEAQALLAEAGYPGGRDRETGEPLRLFFDVQAQAVSPTSMRWIERMLGRLGVQVEFRTANWARTREKLRTGNTQIYASGWLGDYPDPENFLFLLHGPEGPLRCACDGANNSNYARAEYDRLFSAVRTAPPGPEREAMVARMVQLFQQDAVWLFAWFPRDIYLNNPWVHNAQRHGVARNTLKYLRIDAAERARLQRAWNAPRLWPLSLLAVLLLALSGSTLVLYRRRQRRTAFSGG